MLVAGVAEDGRGARWVKEKENWKGKERANGKVWGGIEGEFWGGLGRW
jgi:hypothetical protein